MITARNLSQIYNKAHNIMRNVDGLQPQEAFDELLKYLFFKQHYEVLTNNHNSISYKLVKKLFSNYLGKTNSWSSKIWREQKFFLSDECLSNILLQ